MLYPFPIVRKIVKMKQFSEVGAMSMSDRHGVGLFHLSSAMFCFFSKEEMEIQTLSVSKVSLVTIEAFKHVFIFNINCKNILKQMFCVASLREFNS